MKKNYFKDTLQCKVLRDLLRDLLHLLRRAYLLYSITILFSGFIADFGGLFGRAANPQQTSNRITRVLALSRTLTKSKSLRFVCFNVHRARNKAIKRRFRLDFIATLVTVLL